MGWLLSTQECTNVILKRASVHIRGITVLDSIHPDNVPGKLRFLVQVSDLSLYPVVGTPIIVSVNE